MALSLSESLTPLMKTSQLLQHQQWRKAPKSAWERRKLHSYLSFTWNLTGDPVLSLANILWRARRRSRGDGFYARRRGKKVWIVQAGQCPLGVTHRILVDRWLQHAKLNALAAFEWKLGHQGLVVLFFLPFLFRERACWRSLSPHCLQRARLFAPTQICLFFWEPSEKRTIEGKKKRYAVQCLKYNLIWAKCSPQHPKNETRGHLQPLITQRGWCRLAAAQGCSRVYQTRRFSYGKWGGSHFGDGRVERRRAFNSWQ